MQPLSDILGRRDFLRLGGFLGMAGVSWLTPVGHMLAQAAEKAGKKEPARSIILLWMAGGPSQLETFDPHPGKDIAGETKAIRTSVKGVQFAEGMDHLAEQMANLTVLRSVVSKEGDHERGTYTVKTGYRPDPTVIHPSLGAIICHELPDKKVEIPRHVSHPAQPVAEPGRLPGRPVRRLQDRRPGWRCRTSPPVVPERARPAAACRIWTLLEEDFARRRSRPGRSATQSPRHAGRPAQMMSSEQLKAFDVSHEPEKPCRQTVRRYAPGRGCLAARRLIEVGKALRRGDPRTAGTPTPTTTNQTRKQVKVLDPWLRRPGPRPEADRNLLKSTIVTRAPASLAGRPRSTRLGRPATTGRLASARGAGRWRRCVSGVVLGETDPEGEHQQIENREVKVADIHATVLTAVGLDPGKVNCVVHRPNGSR